MPPKKHDEGGALPADMIQRMRDAIGKDGRSMRAISLAAGFGSSYLSGIVNEGKTPSYWRLARICDELGVTAEWVVGGADVRPHHKKILELASGFDEKEFDEFLDTLINLRSGLKSRR